MFICMNRSSQVVKIVRNVLLRLYLKDVEKATFTVAR